MNYNTLMNGVPSLPPPANLDPHSLYAAFEQITDGRHKRGRRYPLADLLPPDRPRQVERRNHPERGGRVGTAPPGMACRHLPPQRAALPVFLDLYLCVGHTLR